MTNKEKLTWIGSAVVVLPSAGHSTISILKWLVTNADKNGMIKTSLRDISVKAGKSTGTIHKTMHHLAEAKLCEVVSGAGRQARKYKLQLADVQV